MNLTIHQATLNDYSIIQNMARFYVYDLSVRDDLERLGNAC